MSGSVGVCVVGAYACMGEHVSEHEWKCRSMCSGSVCMYG